MTVTEQQQSPGNSKVLRQPKTDDCCQTKEDRRAEKDEQQPTS